MADFAKATGITIQIDSVPSSHETVLKSRIEGGAPPDIAQLAQPTPVLAYAAEGKVIDVATFMDAKKLSDEHPATIGLVTQDGKIWGIPYKADVKSTIWYPDQGIRREGLQGPHDVGRADRPLRPDRRGRQQPVVRQRRRSGAATGWQITDWVEEVVLKTKGLDYYNDWISHKVTFEDPGIKDAFDKVGQDPLHPNYVYGGNTAIVDHRPEDDHGPDVQPGLGCAQLLDAEDPDLVWTGLLPGSAGQRRRRRSTRSG